LDYSVVIRRWVGGVVPSKSAVIGDTVTVFVDTHVS
jgi:carbohydrate-binding DOMON domain-containing protein